MYSVDLRSMGGNHPFGRETFTRREDAERFIEELRREDQSLGVPCGSRSTSSRLAGTTSRRDRGFRGCAREPHFAALI